MLSNLDSSFGELGPLSEFFAGVDVGVLGSLERPLELVELLRSEGRPGAPLLAF